MVKTFNLHESESNKFDEDNNIKVSVQDQYSKIVDFYMTQSTGEFTLAQDTISNDNTFEVETGHGIEVGDTITLKSDFHMSQFQVVRVDTNTITVDSPFDYPYESGTKHEKGIRDMAVDGGVTPQTFKFIPPYKSSIDITRLSFVLIDNADMDFTTFGGISELDNGCVLRTKNGFKYNLFNFKTNGELINRCATYEFNKKTGGGQFALNTISSFSGRGDRGVSIRLNGKSQDTLELIVQDDLSSISDFRIIVQGHFENEE